MSEEYSPANEQIEIVEVTEVPASGPWDQGTLEVGTPIEATPKSNKKVILIVVAVVVALLALCCCGGLILTYAIGSNADSILEELEKINTELPDEPSFYNAEEDIFDTSVIIPENLASHVKEAYLGERFTLDDVIFDVRAGEGEDPSSGSVGSVDVTIINESDRPLTILTDGGWSAINEEGKGLGYNWMISNQEVDEITGELSIGTIAPGVTYRVTLHFADRGEPLSLQKAILVVAELSRPLEGYQSIFWFVSK